MSSGPQYRELPTPTASRPAAAALELEPGAVIAERYRLVRKLGEGGMGAVFLAEHVLMRKRFALKVLLPEAMGSPEIVARFEREAIAAGNIAHPGVCAATDFGRLSDGSFFLVLEYVDGKSLRSLLADGPLVPDRALAIARQVLAALAAAHATGVVHRDIKPENVMIVAAPGGSDLVKVLDFGIAKLDANALAGGDGTNLTQMGAIYGTPTYMAPEQALGQGVDHRADLYAVGVMLHEMITGEPPFAGEGIVVLAQHVNGTPPPLTSPHGAIRPQSVAFVSRLLAKKPADRPDTAAAAVAEIDEIDPTLATAASAASPRPPSARLVTVADRNTGAGELAARLSSTGGQPTGASNPGVATKPSPLHAARHRIAVVLERIAARVGAPVRTVAIAFAGAGALVVLLVLVVVLRRPSVSDEDDAPRRRKRSPPTSATTATATAQPTAKTPAPAATTAGGDKGFVRKVKGVF